MYKHCQIYTDIILCNFITAANASYNSSWALIC